PLATCLFLPYTTLFRSRQAQRMQGPMLDVLWRPVQEVRQQSVPGAVQQELTRRRAESEEIRQVQHELGQINQRKSVRRKNRTRQDRKSTRLNSSHVKIS